MKKKTINLLLWIGIFTVAALDSGTQFVSNFFPVIGQLLDSVSNVIWEIIELALIFGLVKTSK